MGVAHSSHSLFSTGGGDDNGDEETSAAAVSSVGAQAPPPALALVRVPPMSTSKVLEQEPEVLSYLVVVSTLSLPMFSTSWARRGLAALPTNVELFSVMSLMLISHKENTSVGTFELFAGKHIGVVVLLLVLFFL